jgi:uncharacterized protein (TIGR02147 family)
MKKNIFDYKDYKVYLHALIASKPRSGRGMRMSLAKALKVPVSHISQVLGGSSHLTLEQAEGTNAYLGHTEEEANFFLLLIQLARAGTPALRKRLNTQAQQVLEKRFILKERLGVKASLSIEDQATFYSSWIYGAIHVMLSIEEFQTKEAISTYLGISLKQVNEILRFLESIGLAIHKANGRYGIGTARIHLGHDSPMISKFHTNWRMRAIRSLEDENAQNDIHYSSVVTVSDADVTRIKSLLVKNIEEIKTIIRDSKEEGVHCFSLDFFRL